MKTKVGILLIAVLAFSAFAVIPIIYADDSFKYSYPIVAHPDFAFDGILAPGESTPWITVTVWPEHPQYVFPVTQDKGWKGAPEGWTIEAVPGPTYTWESGTTKLEIKIRVTVSPEETVECERTFNVMLDPGKDSKGRAVGSGAGVHFRVCVQIPPTDVFDIECESFMTDSSFNPIESFDTVWTPQDKKGRDYYKLSSTNPGQFMYNIRISNIGTVTAESIEVTFTIDEDFILKGADPIQVWTGYGKTGERIWDVSIVDNTITINEDLAPGGTFWITFHLEYGPARETWTASEMANWKALHEPNWFEADCVAHATSFPNAECHSEIELPDPIVVLGVEMDE